MQVIDNSNLTYSVRLSDRKKIQTKLNRLQAIYNLVSIMRKIHVWFVRMSVVIDYCDHFFDLSDVNCDGQYIHPHVRYSVL